MAIAQYSNFTNWVKLNYPEGPTVVALSEAPFVGLMKHTTDWEGGAKEIHPIYTNLPTYTNFTDAQTYRGVLQTLKFSITRCTHYGSWSIERQLLLSARSNKRAIDDIMKRHMTGGFTGFGHQIGRLAWGNGGGATARISAISTNRATLGTRSDHYGFFPGQVVQASVDDGTGGAGLRSGGATNVVLSVDRENGYIYGASNWTTAIPLMGTTDYLFNAGAYNAAPKGAFAWTPATTPTAGESFLGVDRSVDPTLLAGSRVDASGKFLAEGVSLACALLRENGGKPDTMWLAPTKMGQLLDEMHGKAVIPVERRNPDPDIAIGFKGIKIATPGGFIDVMEDPNLQPRYGYLTRMDDWECASLDDLPHFATPNGSKGDPVETADGIQWRLAGYFNFINHSPQNSARVDFGA